MAREISETAAALLERATATDQAMRRINGPETLIGTGGAGGIMDLDRATLTALMLSPPVLNMLADRIASRLIEDLGRGRSGSGGWSGSIGRTWNGSSTREKTDAKHRDGMDRERLRALRSRV